MWQKSYLSLWVAKVCGLCANINITHHSEGQFNPNPVKKKSLLILDAPVHVDSGNIFKIKIGRRSSVYQPFSKRDLNL
jgi:hypothetical protein